MQGSLQPPPPLASSFQQIACSTLSFDWVICSALRCASDTWNIQRMNSRRCHILCFIHYVRPRYIVDSLYRYRWEDVSQSPCWLYNLFRASVLLENFSWESGESWNVKRALGRRPKIVSVWRLAWNVLICDCVWMYVPMFLPDLLLFPSLQTVTSPLQAIRGRPAHSLPNKVGPLSAHIKYCCVCVHSQHMQIQSTNIMGYTVSLWGNVNTFQFQTRQSSLSNLKWDTFCF